MKHVFGSVLERVTYIKVEPGVVQFPCDDLLISVNDTHRYDVKGDAIPSAEIPQEIFLDSTLIRLQELGLIQTVI